MTVPVYVQSFTHTSSLTKINDFKAIFKVALQQYHSSTTPRRIVYRTLVQSAVSFVSLLYQPLILNLKEYIVIHKGPGYGVGGGGG